MTTEAEIVRRLAEVEETCPCGCHGWFGQEDSGPLDSRCKESHCSGKVPRIPGLRKECQFCFGEGVVIGLHRTPCTPCGEAGWQPVEPDTALRVCLEWLLVQGTHIVFMPAEYNYPAMVGFSSSDPNESINDMPLVAIQDHNAALAMFEAVEQVVEATNER